MKNIHLLLQGKGGVGKSLCASLLAQYHQENNIDFYGIDTDPVNQTFCGYASYSAEHLPLLEEGNIAPRKFDVLMEKAIKKDCHIIIDNGAASFIPLTYYLKENDAFDILLEAQKNVIIHTVVTGGQALHDTLTGLAALCDQISQNIPIVVWLNEFFGEIEMKDKSFEEMKVYTQNAARIAALLRIPRQTSDTFGTDIKNMLDQKLTFKEATASSEFSLMAKSRLARVRKNIFEQISLIPGIKE